MVDTLRGKNSQKVPDAESVIEDSKEYSNKRKYIQVDIEKREELVKMIDEGNVTIKTAADKLEINYSNAKNIVKLYKRYNRIQKLPKRPSSALKEITVPSPPLVEHNQLEAALLPFYDPTEAERFISCRCQPSTTHKLPPLLFDIPNLATRSPSLDKCIQIDFNQYKQAIKDR